MRFTKTVVEDIYVDATISPVKGAGIQVVDGGRSIQTASGKKVALSGEISLADANANEATQKLYAYLKAVGESDSVIFGHQNDTHHKAGAKGGEFSNSDTKDVTGSIAGIIGIDALSLTGDEAVEWNTPEDDRIARVAEITRAAAAEGALITLSAHMPNFDVIDRKVKAYEASGKTGTDSSVLGYWTAADGSKQYNFSGYTPNVLTGNVVSRIMPGQDLNYLYTDYLDLIADYAKAVEGDGITILFRPFHENTGTWFWWGAALCDEQAYINLYRYTVDYLKETKGVHNMLYVYGPGSEAVNTTEYGARYPGDAYVDMIGYDLYHVNPSPENQASYLQSISRQNSILKEFAQKHNKLYAITETGVASNDGGEIALLRKGNAVMDWYMQLLDEIADDGVSYFLVWANFSENGSFYLPYVTNKKKDGNGKEILHGHEMMDEFIRFYNDGRSVFATDISGRFKDITGVTNIVKENEVSGYITAPQSGDRLLSGKADSKTRIAARISGAILGKTQVKFVASSEFDEVILAAEYKNELLEWEAELKDGALAGLGESLGTIALFVDDVEIAKIAIKFNMEAPKQNDLIPEDFEGYGGDSRQLGLAWAVNKASGSEISLSLDDDEEHVFGGAYGLKMDITLASSGAWAGATKSFEADWSEGNALELYTIPDAKGQKVVVQVTSGSEDFEVYLQEYEEYRSNAALGFPVKVTIPFSAFKGKDGGKFNAGKITSIGLWYNALSGMQAPLSTTLYYDEMKVIKTDKTQVQIEAMAKEGIWIKEIPDQTYTGGAIKPDVQVYDAAKKLTLGKDYTVAYSNNVNVGEAGITVKGKGNYAKSITGTFNISPKQVEELTITVPEHLVYNKKAQAIPVTVKDGKKTLSSKKDYTLTISYNGAEVAKAKDEGAYKLTFAMQGNYGGTKTIECEMVKDKLILSKAAIKLPSASLPYEQGKAAVFDEGAVSIKIGGKTVLPKEADGTLNYTVSYENNTQPGTAAVVVTGAPGSGYVGTCRKNFTITGRTFTTRNIDITGFVPKMPYTGKAVYQNLVLKDKALSDDKILEKNVDYKITYQNHFNAGKAEMVITGIGQYEGSIKKTYTIEKIALTKEMIQSEGLTALHNKAGATPDVEIVYNNMQLEKDRDYKLSYTNNKSVTTENKKAYITITGIGSYSGTLKNAVEFEIMPKSWESGEITVEVPDMKYSKNKAKYEPAPVVMDNGVKLAKNKDYTVEYSSNAKADIQNIENGSHAAEVIIILKGADYTVEGKDAKKSFKFRIAEKMISEAKINLKSGKEQYFSQSGAWPKEEDLDVSYKKQPVDQAEYEIISYEKNDRKGKATLLIRGKGSFAGTKKFAFTVKAKEME